MPGDPGATVVTNARAFYTTRAAAGATGTRHSPRPLLRVAPRPLEGSAAPSRFWAKRFAKLGRSLSRDHRHVFGISSDQRSDTRRLLVESCRVFAAQNNAYTAFEGVSRDLGSGDHAASFFVGHNLKCETQCHDFRRASFLSCRCRHRVKQIRVKSRSISADIFIARYFTARRAALWPTS
jgi:hypothetical protein